MYLFLWLFYKIVFINIEVLTKPSLKMTKGCLLFILGSGASVDSGLFTYRGCNSINTSIVSNEDDTFTIWRKLEQLIMRINEIKDEPISPTYSLIQTIIDSFNERSCIMTQNVDGLVNKLSDVDIVELHGNLNRCKCEKCKLTFPMRRRNEDKLCEKCFNMLKPDIVLLGDYLKVDYKKYLKRRYTYIIVIGTTLQFPYLRNIIGKAKQYGGRVIHINPDPDYNIPRIKTTYTYSFNPTYKKISNVRKGEQFINTTASEGLKEFIETL